MYFIYICMHYYLVYAIIDVQLRKHVALLLKKLRLRNTYSLLIKEINKIYIIIINNYYTITINI